MKRKGYGIIEFVDKRKLKDDGWDDQIEPEFRKPTPAEREEIILNYIRTHNDKPLNMRKLAVLLAVSVRTIQKHLRNNSLRTVSFRRVNNLDIFTVIPAVIASLCNVY